MKQTKINSTEVFIYNIFIMYIKYDQRYVLFFLFKQFYAIAVRKSNQ